MIISADEMNQALNTVIIAPMTSRMRHYPTRIAINLQSKSGEIALEQIRTVDKQRLYRKLGRIPTQTATKVADLLCEMFRL